MKKFLALLALIPAALLGQSNPTNVQKGGPTVPSTQISNGPVQFGSGNTLSAVTGATVNFTGATQIGIVASDMPWSSLTGIPSPTISLTGDATTSQTLLASGGSTSVLTMATVNGNVGTFASVTANAKGLITAGADLSGDATTSGSVLTLATVNSGPGSFGSATQTPVLTVNGKGLVTASTAATVTPTYTNVTGVPTVSLLGNPTGGTANASAITLTSNLQFTGTTLDTIQPITTASSPTFAALTLTAPLTGANGGTGVANSGKTITLGGDLATSGAFASTFTMTGNTGVTFPTSGTLATTAGVVDSIAGTANEIAASASTGAVTLSIPSTFIAPGTIAASNLSLGGNLTTANALTTTGNFAVSLAFPGAYTYTFPSATSTLAPTVSPVFTTPTMGAALATSINGLTLTSSTGTLTVANGKTITQSNSLTYTGNDGSSVAFGAGGTVLYSGGPYVSSISGTANQIVASASTGAVTLSIPSTFIAPGTIAATNLSLGGTLTTANALTTSGNYAVTLTYTGNTSVTFPTSGTLATTGGTVDSIAGTANEIAASASTGAVTLSIPSTFIAPGTIAATNLSLGGTLTTANAVTVTGNFASTITVTGNTTSTLPSGTHTLAQLDGPTFTGSPALSTATATSINGLTLTSSTGTLTITNNKTLAASNSLTLTGNDGSSVAFGAGGTVLYSGGAYVSSLSGTANQITASASTGAVTLSLLGPFAFTTQTAHGVLLGEGTSPLASSSAGASGQPFLSGGSSADGAFGALSLAGGSSVVAGILPVANGGSGQTTANAALNAFLPSQSGVTSGWVLSTNGTNTAWAAPGSGSVTTTGSPATSYLAYFTGATSISGTTNATLSSAGNLGINDLTFTGSVIGNWTTVTSNQSLGTSNYGVIVNATGGTTMTLPTSPTSGTSYVIINENTGTVTVSGAQNVNGSSGGVTLGQYSGASFTYNGTQWVTNAPLIAADSILGNSSGSAAVPSALTALPFVVSLATGGSNANLTASNGGIVYSTASAMAILAGTSTADRMLLSGSSTTPAWSTATYPATTTASQLLYSSSANTIAGLSTANNGVLITNGSGVPSFLAAGTNTYVLTMVSGAPAWAASPGLAGFDGSTAASPISGTHTLTLTQPVTIIYVTATSAASIFTLPAASASAGQAVEIIIAVGGANHVNFQPASGDTFYFKGAASTVNYYLQDASSATSYPFDFIWGCSDGTNWSFQNGTGYSGTWATSSSS